ncbi:phosphomannomutase [Desulfocucumis palustris]|uniref:Phosphomannomutase n=1 Tax=Desulfocucumis palustris TaxID=1898651 RepID=A0A2L2X9C9_9FIRM|nr:phosphomannomutase/phosphoglucomutase [Desulfocucumis palustris]GBF32738.1 phosphomannomutase [Desulfocucumis palustris]
MQVNANIFREYDIRGEADRDLTNETVILLGKAFGTTVRRKGLTDVLVGMDNRRSSPRLSESITVGLLSTGCNVINIGTVVTPIFYYARVKYEIEAGVMITGSHNPSEDNGFKIALGPATIHGEEIQSLRRLIETGDFETGTGQISSRDPVPDYKQMLQEKISLGNKKLKVVLDCGNGTASYFAQDIVKSWYCDVVPLFCEPDPDFPNHHPDPVKRKNLQGLIKTVLSEKADVGVAFDGDADRIGVVDDTGEVIWGDQFMALMWPEILSKHPGAPAIIEVKCSQTLVDEVRRLGGKPVFYKTGHSLIKAKMKELNAPFTGEMSGHMFFADEYYGYDDAFYATGRLLRMMSNSSRPLSASVKDLPKYYSTAETRVPCPDGVKFNVVKRLQDYFRDKYEVIDVDGVRVLFGDGWGLVRASNTQPVLVARCEAKTPARLEEISGIMKDAMAGQPEVGQFEWEY